jgi:hypothetical protein
VVGGMWTQYRPPRPDSGPSVTSLLQGYINVTMAHAYNVVTSRYHVVTITACLEHVLSAHTAGWVEARGGGRGGGARAYGHNMGLRAPIRIPNKVLAGTRQLGAPSWKARCGGPGPHNFRQGTNIPSTNNCVVRSGGRRWTRFRALSKQGGADCRCVAPLGCVDKTVFVTGHLTPAPAAPS